MTRLVVALVLLAGCARVTPTPDAAAQADCFTPCGLRAPNVDCEGLRRMERDVVRTFARYVDLWEEADICSAFQGWAIEFKKPMGVPGCRTGWLVNPTFCAGGYTEPRTRTVSMIYTDWHHGVLAHELIHVTDLAKYGHAGHCRWKDRGVSAALLELTGRVDDSDVCDVK